jgi:hypothetical protein
MCKNTFQIPGIGTHQRQSCWSRARADRTDQSIEKGDVLRIAPPAASDRANARQMSSPKHKTNRTALPCCTYRGRYTADEMDEIIEGEEAPLLSLTIHASDVCSREPATSLPRLTLLRTHVRSARSLRARESQYIQPLELRFSATLGYESEVELELI